MDCLVVVDRSDFYQKWLWAGLEGYHAGKGREAFGTAADMVLGPVESRDPTKLDEGIFNYFKSLEAPEKTMFQQGHSAAKKRLSSEMDKADPQQTFMLAVLNAVSRHINQPKTITSERPLQPADEKSVHPANVL